MFINSRVFILVFHELAGCAPDESKNVLAAFWSVIPVIPKSTKNGDSGATDATKIKDCNVE
jgi:hypothetical protein